jgi:hypothetical protein
VDLSCDAAKTRWGKNTSGLVRVARRSLQVNGWRDPNGAGNELQHESVEGAKPLSEIPRDRISRGSYHLLLFQVP